MKQIIRVLLPVMLGITCLTAIGYASPERFMTTPAPLRALRFSNPEGESGLGVTQDQMPQLMAGDQQSRGGSRKDVVDFAYKLSYLGVVLLTADQVVRSVDSIMDRMQLNCADGTRIRLSMRPGRKGIDVMLKLNRSLDF